MIATIIGVPGVLAAVTAAILLAPAGCADGVSHVKQAAIAGSAPEMPVPIVGYGSVAGNVRSETGEAVPGAWITIAETGATVLADATGAYQLVVSSDSTVTLLAIATGFAPTFHESVIVASQATVADFDFLLLAPDRVTAINALGAPGQESARGLMAIRLHSMDPSCVTDGARITVWPPLAATVVYSRAGSNGSVDEPDIALTGVQAGAAIDLWLAATVPPGNGIVVHVQQPGCRVMQRSPSVGGLLFPGQRHVVARAMTQANLFLGRAE